MTYAPFVRPDLKLTVQSLFVAEPILMNLAPSRSQLEQWEVVDVTLLRRSHNLCCRPCKDKMPNFQSLQETL